MIASLGPPLADVAFSAQPKTRAPQFSASRGLDDARLALALLAIEPGLKGVLMGGPPGTGKSALARAARALWSADRPFVNVPLGVTMDRLIGGMDFERTLQAGRPIALPGLLAAAHGGVLYVDEINLLEPATVHVICQALTAGEVRLEREGLGLTYPANFVLIGTFNPAEGPVAPALIDRVAFAIPVTALNDAPGRAAIAVEAHYPLRLPHDMIQMVEVGRQLLPSIRLPRNAIQELCAAATALEVRGNRSEVFAVRCAAANAALNARAPITQSDIDLAVRLVLARRATHHLQIDSPNADQPPVESPSSEDRTPRKSPDAPEHAGRNRSNGKPTPDQASVKPEAEPRQKSLSALIQAFEAKGGTASGKRGRGLNTRRGRHIRSLPGHPGQGRLALVDTLKAAALSAATRSEAPSHSPPLRGETALLVQVRRDDIRIKQFRQRTGLLVIFAVDASGSMALNRMSAVKAAAISLLQSAYVHRDKIALVSFRRDRAEVVLSPGGGVAKARRALENLPTGGRTPLSAALAAVASLAREKACRLHVGGTVLVLLTDGRANQPMRPLPPEGDRETLAGREVERLAKQLRPLLAGSVVIDTRRVYVPDGYARDLAKWLDARYVFLPKVSAAEIAKTVRGEVARLR